MFLCCSLATDFLPTFMYCMGSGNFDVVQTALRNLPEYVLLCQGENMLFSHILMEWWALLRFLLHSHDETICFRRERFNICCTYSIFSVMCFCLSRTRRHLAPQGVFSGDLWTDWHQLNDCWIHEGPSHGINYIIKCTTTLNSSNDIQSLYSRPFFFLLLLLMCCSNLTSTD